MNMGVSIVPLHNMTAIHPDHVALTCVYTQRVKQVAAGTVIPVTMQTPVSSLYDALSGMAQRGSLTRIGDCYAPGTIAAAVYSGHRYARELGEPLTDAVPFKRELPALAAD
jgi:dimethylamine/trimethylamine dehydrogenase